MDPGDERAKMHCRVGGHSYALHKLTSPVTGVPPARYGRPTPGLWLGLGILWRTGVAQEGADIRWPVGMGRSGPAVGYPAVCGP